MTKNKKNELVWRLKERPSAEGVAKLVEQNVINNVEARELLFSTKEEKDNSEETKALKEQIEFLKGLVDTLSKQRATTTYIPYTHTIRTPSRYWDDIAVWGKASGNIMMSTNSSYSNGKTKEWTTLSVQ